MFLKLMNMLKQKTSSNVDPSAFNDPVAMKTEWSPAKRGGSNYRTHKLVQSANNRYEFKGTAFSIIFAAIFIIAGLGIMFTFAFVGIKNSSDPDGLDIIIPSLFGGIFAVIGALFYYFGTAPRCFDKTTGYYWKGRTEPNVMIQPDPRKFTRLEDIHAIQILSEWVRSNKSSYTSYELNLVLEDGSRINVIDHGSLKWIRKDAAMLAGFLGVPLWDAINK